MDSNQKSLKFKVSWERLCVPSDDLRFLPTLCEKRSFLDRMRSVHRLNPGPCPVGRPKTTTQVR